MFLSKVLTLLYNQRLHRDRKHFCRYCLQAFSTAQILERHVNDCFEMDGKRLIKIAENSETVKFKDYTRKIKSTLMIYADFENILVPWKANGKQNPDES